MTTIESIFNSLNQETLEQAQQNVETMKNEEIQEMHLRMIAYNDLT